MEVIPAKAENGKSFLEHYGVKGMKWGVRRSRRQLAREAKSRTGRSVKDMSDDELRSLVNRMQLEQQYTSLSRNGRKKNAGAEFAKSIAVGVARTQITNAANAQIAKALSKRSK